MDDSELSRISAFSANLPDNERSLLDAIANDPGNSELHHRLGAMLHGAGRFQDALTSFRRACDLNANSSVSHHNLGIVYAELSQMSAAEKSFRRAIRIDPQYIEAHCNLAGLLNWAGRSEEAIEALGHAVGIHPDSVELRANFGIALNRVGRYDEAEKELRFAVQHNPAIVEAHLALGMVYRSLGRIDECVASYRTAVKVQPSAHALCSLGVALYREEDAGESEAILTRALSMDAGNWMALFYLGVIRDIHGDVDAARDYFARAASNGGRKHGVVESWDYMKSRRNKSTRQCRSGFELLSMAMDAARETGLVLEFGVWNGASIRFIGNRTKDQVHGFDTFSGLPEAWADEPAGSNSAQGVLPEVPENVHLHVGLFENTLPGFLDAHDGPIRFMHIDCDSYNSTKSDFDALSHRVVPGTVIVFDEYFMYGDWQEGEFKSFREAATANGWRYKYIAFNLYSKQVAVRIID
ncbi:MAG: tetratricopeptide repeat protein [Pseudomonadota bacterium]|nr:tetratricopeptide repeat protein [Pseudomonadota bacterium]